MSSNSYAELQRKMSGLPLDDRDRFEERVEDHVLSEEEPPYHHGRLPAATLTGHARNPHCGDVVRLDLAVDEAGRVREAWHDGRGCLVSRTAASLLCREIEGKTLTELRAMPAEAMLDLLGLPLTPVRRVCALLPWSCLQSILRAAADPPKAA